MRTSKTLLAAAMAAALTVPSLAQDGQLTVFGIPLSTRAGDPPIDVYGDSQGTSVIQVSQWQPVGSGITWKQPVAGYLNLTAGNSSPNFYAPLSLDWGVEIRQVCARVYDASATEQVTLMVGAFESADGDEEPAVRVLEAVSTGLASHPGYTMLCTLVEPALRLGMNADIDSNGSVHTAQYWVGVTLHVTDDTAVGPAIVLWRRTVSPPPPGAASFLDVPASHPFFQFIEALHASGITAGCGAGNFCPDSPVTRGQMAVFLAKALGLYWPG